MCTTDLVQLFFFTCIYSTAGAKLKKYFKSESITGLTNYSNCLLYFGIVLNNNASYCIM